MSDMQGPFYGKYPAEVDSYDGATRMCRVRVPGVTDGSSVLPLAEIQYPVGDRVVADNAKDRTEIRILPGDAVYVEFLGGDARFPLITGSRLDRAGVPVDWRRWRHANIEMTADNQMIFNAASVIWNVTGNVTEHIGGSRTTDIGSNESTTITGSQSVQAASSTHQASTHTLTAQTQINGAITTGSGPGGAGANIAGPVAITGSTVTHDGKNIGKQHYHTAQGATADTTTAKP